MDFTTTKCGDHSSSHNNYLQSMERTRAQRVLKQERKKVRERKRRRVWEKEEEVTTEEEELGEDGRRSLLGVGIKISSKFQVGVVWELCVVWLVDQFSFRYKNLKGCV